MKKLKLAKTEEKIFMDSIIHWDKPVKKRDPSGTNRIMIPITCGKCGFNRLWRLDMVFRKQKTGEFTGVCKNCYNKLTWFEKHRLRPAKRKETSAGYIKVFQPEHPMADKRGEVYEHRLVMSEILKRPLEKWEHVHHKDGNRANNSPANLQLIPNKEHGPIKDMIKRIRYLEGILIQYNIPF